MRKALASALLILCGLAGCSAVPTDRGPASPCATNPGGYDCQIERYQNAPG